MPQALAEITPRELARRLADERLLLLDVREPWEFEHCHITGATLMPLSDLPSRVHELGRDLPVVTICHHGMRSYYAAEFLLNQGYSPVLNLAGGIHRWAAEVELTMPQY